MVVVSDHRAIDSRSSRKKLIVRGMPASLPSPPEDPSVGP
jgi:hypothetical protein